jgi:CBS domain-containing protein
VHRYVAGKIDWAAAGWEREGELSEAPFVGDIARRDVPTCRPDETVGDARARADAAGWDRCVVVGDGGVVLGLLSGPRLGADARLRADLVMEPGPSTFRVSLPVAEMAGYMRENNVQNVLVTTGDGVLAGAIDRRSVEEAVDGRARD